MKKLSGRATGEHGYLNRAKKIASQGGDPAINAGLALRTVVGGAAKSFGRGAANWVINRTGVGKPLEENTFQTKLKLIREARPFSDPIGLVPDQFTPGGGLEVGRPATSIGPRGPSSNRTTRSFGRGRGRGRGGGGASGRRSTPQPVAKRPINISSIRQAIRSAGRGARSTGRGVGRALKVAGAAVGTAATIGAALAAGVSGDLKAGEWAAKGQPAFGGQQPGHDSSFNRYRNRQMARNFAMNPQQQAANEGVMSTLKTLTESTKIYELEITPVIASKITKLYESLNEKNKLVFLEMINKDRETFLKVTNFALNN
jgi:hypothetical protein